MDFQAAKFWVFYDGECGFCTGWARRMAGILRGRNIGMAMLQDEAVRERLGLLAGEVPGEMKVLTGDGRILGGAAAIVHVCRHVWWLFPVFVVGQIPPVRWMMEKCYRWIAARRYCLAGRCGLDASQRGRVA